MKISQYVRGADRELVIDGARYLIEHVAPPRDFPPNASWDAWRYTLPDGASYTHPTQFGALLMILKHLGGGAWVNSA